MLIPTPHDRGLVSPSIWHNSADDRAIVQLARLRHRSLRSTTTKAKLRGVRDRPGHRYRLSDETGAAVERQGVLRASEGAPREPSQRASQRLLK